MHEAILYYFRAKETREHPRFIIITNFYHFYIFKKDIFDKLFYKNKEFQQTWQNFGDKNLTTETFYHECKQILQSKEFEESLSFKKDEVLFTYDNDKNTYKYKQDLSAFHLDLSPFLKDNYEIDIKNFRHLKNIFKCFHKDFLLNTFNPNDANILNKGFYNELLYILGLEEVKQNGKIIITQSKESKAGSGTLYTAIWQKCKDKESFKAKSDEEKFESLMQLIILWLNRILFLKLIEASLVKFNDNTNLKFLNTKKVPSFRILSGLFFDILAKNSQQREAKDLEHLYYLPYLNSSLFEKQDIEQDLLEIKDLENLELEYYKLTQIKDKNTKKKQGKTSLLSYLFEFLDSFDFGSDEEEGEFIEQKNDLINSAVLGLVFEKLNGYKEGSFYTPSFITSYMCRQSLQKIIIDKFNEANPSWNATSLQDIEEEIQRELRQARKKQNFSKASASLRGSETTEAIHEFIEFSRNDSTANSCDKVKTQIKAKHKALLQSLKICDPAVGSGHFLVSALNEMLFIHSELNLLENDFFIELKNDEIHIKDGAKDINYKNPHLFKTNEDLKAHKVQQELFELKKSIIENNLFGVDINANSCEITKLRLWIELLKSSYYADYESQSLREVAKHNEASRSADPHLQIHSVIANECEAIHNNIDCHENSYEFSRNDKKHSPYHDLATLPNIDINIQCGNSLTSIFEFIEVDQNQRAKKGSLRYLCENDREFANNIKQKINEYKSKVNAYKNNLGIKENLRKDIKKIKNFFKERLIEISDEMELFKADIKCYIENFGDEDFDIESDFGFEVLRIKRKNNYVYENTLDMGDEFTKKPDKEKLFKKLLMSYQKLQDVREKESFEWRFEFPEVLDSNGDFKGFDLIIGNPPYIRQEEIKELKPQLQKAFKIYKGTSDIYTYFYELGFRLLRQGGIVSFITSNKWCRAAYGEALREFLLQNTSLLEYVDCNGIKVFESATVDTSILSFEKAKKKDNLFKYLAPSEIKEGKELEFGTNFRTLKQRDLNKEAFIFTDEAFSQLKAKIEKIGTPLKDWDISINYGIKTGYNEAFIIDSAKREEILASCKDEAERARTSELIKPILRGRDIKRYAYEWAGLWIINTHNGYTIEGSTRHCEEQSDEAIHNNKHIDCHESAYTDSRNDKIKIPPIDIEEYPTLKAYFDRVASEGKQGKGKGFYKRDDKGITPYNLRNCAYLEEFAKPKIIYPNMAKEFIAYLDNQGFFTNQKCFILTDKAKDKNRLLYLTAVLNSKINFWYFKQIGATLGASGYEMSKIFVEKLPVIEAQKLDSKVLKEIESLSQQILESKALCHTEAKGEVSHTKSNKDISHSMNAQYDKDTQDLEQRLDTLIYQSYGLNENEISLIEAEFANTERERENRNN